LQDPRRPTPGMATRVPTRSALAPMLIGLRCKFSGAARSFLGRETNQGRRPMDARRRTTLFREVNERIDELLHVYGAEDEADFLCECPTPCCARLLPLRRREFERIRASGAFVVAPECARWVTAIERTAEYVVVGEFRPPLAAVPRGGAAASQPGPAGVAAPARSASRALSAGPAGSWALRSVPSLDRPASAAAAG
jgi:hypothetical protein